MESNLRPSLHSNCQHHITYAKFNLKIPCPPSYEREAWSYQKANTDHIRKAIELFPWNRSFKGLNEMTLMIWYIYLTELSKIYQNMFFQTIFYMNL